MIRATLTLRLVAPAAITEVESTDKFVNTWPERNTRCLKNSEKGQDKRAQCPLLSTMQSGRGLPSAAETARAQEILRAPSPAVRAILTAHRCATSHEMLVAFERIQAGRYDDQLTGKEANPMLKRKQQLAAAELGFAMAKAKRQALNELLAGQQQPTITSMMNTPATMPLGSR